MVTKEPLLPGDAEIDQLFKTFRLLSTPNEMTWPGVSALPDFKSTFPKWSKKPLSAAVPGLCADGIDLLEGMLVYEPGTSRCRRVAASPS